MLLSGSGDCGCGRDIQACRQVIQVNPPPASALHVIKIILLCLVDALGDAVAWIVFDVSRNIKQVSFAGDWVYVVQEFFVPKRGLQRQHFPGISHPCLNEIFKRFMKNRFVRSIRLEGFQPILISEDI
ncbi:hypothetical protein Daci_0576 [Delftia acidovorans SPH-1]|uniref:Uncharacterized protein n=1 Tax=Delftia acidovorans (strain DSM 14801 / SPH-1) TaxID=398578 RepID=A9BQ07_DELAS|nr:hypothetical protein Daci_0576 [Delftia acidovorans SPH-1]